MSKALSIAIAIILAFAVVHFGWTARWPMATAFGILYGIWLGITVPIVIRDFRSRNTEGE